MLKSLLLAIVDRVLMEVLKEHGIPPYDYGEKDFKKDRQAIAKYRRAVKK